MSNCRTQRSLILFLVILMQGCGCADMTPEPEPENFVRSECVKYETRDVQVCNSDAPQRMVVGMLLGGLIGGAIGIKSGPGSMMGAGVGAAGSEVRCKTEKENHCVKIENRVVPNPKYKPRTEK